MTPTEQTLVVRQLVRAVTELTSDVRQLHTSVAMLTHDSEQRERRRDRRFRIAVVVAPVLVASTLGLIGVVVQAYATTQAARIEAGK